MRAAANAQNQYQSPGATEGGCGAQQVKHHTGLPVPMKSRWASKVLTEAWGWAPVPALIHATPAASGRALVPPLMSPYAEGALFLVLNGDVCVSPSRLDGA